MDDRLQKFEKLLKEKSKGGFGGSIDLLLTQMDEEKAEQLRLCAIPHQFDVSILQILVPELDNESALNLYTELSNLSIVISVQEGAALHDEARDYLFNYWLQGEHQQRFVSASNRLTKYYEKTLLDSEGVTKERIDRNRIFHLIGVSQSEGLSQLGELFSDTFNEFRLSDCKNILDLAHEYNNILNTEHTLWLTYYESMLAGALRQLSRAERLLEEIISHEEISSQLQVRAHNRMGLLYKDQRMWSMAINILNKVLELAKNSGEHADFIDNIMHDIGSAYRDSGDLNQAAKFLNEGLRIATEQNDHSTIALSYNSLGTLEQRLGRPHIAISMYEKSLEVLISNDDKFGPAQVYNNLGMTYADLREWQKSEELLQKSLEIKQKAGDSRGQAMTLTNLVRVYINLQSYDQAIAVSQRAINLFKSVKDEFNTAQATRNMGKLYRSMGNQELAKETFEDAIRLFSKCGATKEVESTETEIKALEGTYAALPWWGWALIVLAVVLFGTAIAVLV